MLAAFFMSPTHVCSSSVDTEPSYCRVTFSAPARVTAAALAFGLASSARLDRPRRSCAMAFEIATLSWLMEPVNVRRLSKMDLNRGHPLGSS